MKVSANLLFLLEFFLGWKDSNLRMAGSKPFIGSKQINNLLTPLEIPFPFNTLGYPKLSLGACGKPRHLCDPVPMESREGRQKRAHIPEPAVCILP